MFSLLFLFALPISGLFAYLFLRSVLHFRTWFIAVLFIAVGLVLHFATLSVLMLACGLFVVF